MFHDHRHLYDAGSATELGNLLRRVSASLTMLGIPIFGLPTAAGATPTAVTVNATAVPVEMNIATCLTVAVVMICGCLIFIGGDWLW